MHTHFPGTRNKTGYQSRLMQKTISLHLEILGTDSTWQWKIFHRHGNGNSSISGKLPFPVQIKPKDVLNLLQSDNFQNRTEYANFGANLLKQVIPAELSEIFSAADNGDCLFEVPSPWASVPFELLFDAKGFFCERFKIGTIIHVSGKETGFKPNAVRPLSFGIIADPSADLPHAYEEGLAIKKLLQGSGYPIRMISECEPKKVYETFTGASVVHFAGHSVFSPEEKKCGWKLKNDQIFNINNQVAEGVGSSPLVVFSNSCEAARTSATLAGIAGAMMQSGVFQVIGPMTRVSDAEARDCAAMFFQEFLKSGQPAKSLYAMKKSCKQNPAGLVYRLFGDPCWVFPQASLSPEEEVKPQKSSRKKRNKLFFITIAAILLILLTLILFLPLPESSGIMYIPGK
jgi:hypothetical protein